MLDAHCGDADHARVACCPSQWCEAPRTPWPGRPVCREHLVHSCWPFHTQDDPRADHIANGHPNSDLQGAFVVGLFPLSSVGSISLSARLAPPLHALTSLPVGPPVHLQTNTIQTVPCAPCFCVGAPVIWCLPSAGIRNKPCSNCGPPTPATAPDVWGFSIEVNEWMNRKD